jgi:ankyrin repeat protein
MWIAWICSMLLLSARAGPLAEAVRSGQHAEALKLLEQGADPNELDTRRNTPLMWAASSGQIEVARALLDRQALINSQHDEPRYDALRLAAQNQHIAMIDFLLSRGADPGVAEPWPALPDGYPEKLSRIGHFLDGVRNTARGGAPSRLEALLAESPPDSRQSGLDAALWVAAQLGDASLVRKVLARNANPVSDHEGKTALQLAAQHQRAEVVKLLVSAGIRRELVREAIPMNRLLMTPEVREAFGETAKEPEAIAAALQARDAASLNKLIRSGAYAYWTADPILHVNQLRQATERGHTEIARMLSASEKRNESLKQVLERMSTACRERQSDDCSRINNVVNWYSARLSAPQWRPTYSRDYFLSLQAMADVLQANPEAQIVKDIADELEARRDYCLLNNVGMGGSVTVSVHTRNQQKEVPNWQVYYLLKIFERNPAVAPGAFLKWSSPASEIIEPGRYWVWAKDPKTNSQSERKLVSLSGAQSFSVDLFVP